MTLLLGLPVAIGLGMYFGRKAMRLQWRLDLPYKDRPTMSWGMRTDVPIIKDGVWPL
jgi:hypothetical protein